MNNPGEIQACRFFFEEFGCNHENLDKGLALLYATFQNGNARERLSSYQVMSI
jgi:hypothetical protein